jgi:hypothetical protein
MRSPVRALLCPDEGSWPAPPGRVHAASRRTERFVTRLLVKRGPQLPGSDSLGRTGRAAVTDTNRRNTAPRRTTTGFLMLLFWFMWLGLVLGGGAGALWYGGVLRGTWSRLARAEAPRRRPVWHRHWECFRSARAGVGFLPPPRVVTRAGPHSDPANHFRAPPGGGPPATNAGPGRPPTSVSH